MLIRTSLANDCLHIDYNHTQRDDDVLVHGEWVSFRVIFDQ